MTPFTIIAVPSKAQYRIESMQGVFLGRVAKVAPSNHWWAFYSTGAWCSADALGEIAEFIDNIYNLNFDGSLFKP